MKDHILVIETWQRNEYGGFTARELWKSESGESWNWRKYNDNPGKWTPPTEGIELYAQCNLYPSNDDNHGMYAMNVTIGDKLSMKDMEQARANLNRLARIEKKYTELCNRFGYPRTFAQFASYVADVIGAQLAEYSNISGDYVSTDVTQIAYKEEKLTHSK